MVLANLGQGQRCGFSSRSRNAFSHSVPSNSIPRFRTWQITISHPSSLDNPESGKNIYENIHQVHVGQRKQQGCFPHLPKGDGRKVRGVYQTSLGCLRPAKNPTSYHNRILIRNLVKCLAA